VNFSAAQPQFFRGLVSA